MAEREVMGLKTCFLEITAQQAESTAFLAEGLSGKFLLLKQVLAFPPWRNATDM